MDPTYSPDGPRRPDWTLIGFWNTPFGRCTVWQHIATPKMVTVSVAGAPPWDAATDNTGMTVEAWKILMMSDFVPVESEPDPDPSDWGFEVDA